MKMISVLFRRDLMLIKMNILKRIGLLLGLNLLIALLSALQGDRWTLIYSFAGIDAATFQRTFFSFPVGWVVISLSAVLVSFDFVREDFFEYSANILARVRKRYFWLSKMLAGAVLSLLLLLLFSVMFAAAGLLYSSVYGEELINFAVWRMICPYQFGTIFLGYCLFQLSSLFFREGAGILIVFVCFCLGMSSDSFWFPVNHLMAVRSLELNPLGVSTLTENMVLIGAATIAAILAGFVISDRIDVFSRKESE